MECPICLGISELLSPPAGYCDHELCMSCWVSTGERNPLCPICRCDLTEWMKSMKIKINSKERYDDDEYDYDDYDDYDDENSELMDHSLFVYCSILREHLLSSSRDDTILSDFLTAIPSYYTRPNIGIPDNNYYARYDQGILSMSEIISLPGIDRDDILGSQTPCTHGESVFSPNMSINQIAGRVNRSEHTSPGSGPEIFFMPNSD